MLRSFGLAHEVPKIILPKFGIIFNTDEHYKSGSHWISLFFDIFNTWITNASLIKWYAEAKKL